MSELEKTELEKTDSEKSELEKFKERHSLDKLDGVIIYDKPTIKTGEKAGCIGALLLLIGFGTGIILLLLHFIFDFDSKLLNLLWESIAALGFIFSLAGVFKSVLLQYTATQEKLIRINILKLIEPIISIMFSINRLKQSFSNMIVTKIS